jgi:hypothetical protein
MDYVSMVAPDGSQQKLVPAVPEEIVPLMIQGWRQADPPAPPEEPPKEEQE